MAIIQCKECGGKVSTTAITCPHCGSPNFANLPSLSSPIKQSINDWESNLLKSNLTTRKFFVGFFGLIFCITILQAMLSSNSEVRSDHPSSSSAVDTASAPTVDQSKAEPTAQTIKESCQKLISVFGYDSQYSEVRKKDLWEKYKGKRFKWHFQLISATEEYDGDYTVTFVCLPHMQKPALVDMIYPSVAKAEVLKFKKNRIYTVSGTLSDFDVAPPELADQVSVKFQAEPVLSDARKPSSEVVPK